MAEITANNGKKIDDNICPFCNHSNKCGIKETSPCWCSQTEVPSALLELIPAHLRRKSCVCHSCIQAFKCEPVAFRKRYLEEVKN